MAKQEITGMRFVGSIHEPAHQRLVSQQPLDGDRVIMTGELSPSGHTITLDVVHRGGAYRVTAVKVTAAEDDEITSADLGLPIKDAAERLLRKTWAVGEMWLTGDAVPTNVIRERVAEFKQRQRRRWLTDAHLRDVADAHHHAEQGGASSVIRAVAERFGVSVSTAERWVRVARQRGILATSPRQTGDSDGER